MPAMADLSKCVDCGEFREHGHECAHAVLVAYLLCMVKLKDWHAVSDAANDLRVLEAKRQ